MKHFIWSQIERHLSLYIKELTVSIKTCQNEHDSKTSFITVYHIYTHEKNITDRQLDVDIPFIDRYKDIYFSLC